MKNQSTDNAKDRIPVTAAKFMAYLTLSMSLGFALLVYFLFIKDVFVGDNTWLILVLMLVMSGFSAWAALRSIRQKMLCSSCGQPFFSGVGAMFQSAQSCAACQQSID